jgi:diadenosine tetraphosphate (Ap4A) HIT family hydrolase
MIPKEEDWMNKREVPDLFPSHRYGMLTLGDLASFWKRFAHILSKRRGSWTDHTNCHQFHIEATVPGCHFHVDVESYWDGSDFHNKFIVWADKRLNFNSERFEEIIKELSGRSVGSKRKSKPTLKASDSMKT